MTALLGNKKRVKIHDPEKGLVCRVDPGTVRVVRGASVVVLLCLVVARANYCTA